MTKLLVQGDDYGFTKAVTLGIVEGIDNGILRNTGLFANMPSAEFAVSFMKDRPQVCFGIDFNIVSGPSVSDPKDIPHLVDENGEFIRSGVRVKDPMFRTEEGRRAMFPFEETYREIRAQYDRFVELTGKKPGYLHGHSLSHEHYMEAIRRVSEETGVPYSADIKKKYGFRSQFDLMHFDMEKMDPSKMKKEFPDWVYVNPEASGSTDVSIVDKADHVYFFTDTISHSKYYQFMNVVRERKLILGISTE